MRENLENRGQSEIYVWTQYNKKQSEQCANFVDNTSGDFLFFTKPHVCHRPSKQLLLQFKTLFGLLIILKYEKNYVQL